MNADEIVRALRDAPNYNAGLGTSTLEDEAADLIESLQAQFATEKRRADAAVEDMALIVGDSNGALKCNVCVYNPNDMGCELDGSQFDDDGECHWTYRGRNKGNG